ncbi:lens fiber membrane intrinsic protein-like isoform X4 [Anas acuta]
MAAPRARGGPQHPPHTPPPRPPHPSARTDGHRRRDRGTEGRPWGTPLVGAEGGGRCRSGGGLLCAASGLALLVTATATDFWLQHRAPGGTAAIGLWHLCLGGHCRPPPGPPAFWDATRVLMLLAVLAAATGFALGLSAAAAGAARRARARAAGVTLLLAGVLALLGLAVCTAGARSLLGPAPGAWRLSWSYLLAWVAVVLTGSAGLFHLCAAAKDPSPESSESGGP